MHGLSLSSHTKRARKNLSKMKGFVDEKGFEPLTSCLIGKCSTPELLVNY